MLLTFIKRLAPYVFSVLRIFPSGFCLSLSIT